MIDKNEIKRLRMEENLTFEAIGKKLGCSKQYVAMVCSGKKPRYVSPKAKENAKKYAAEYRKKHREKYRQYCEEWRKRKKAEKKENRK